MIKMWNLSGLSYDNTNPLTGGQQMEYMPIEPPYPIDDLEKVAY